MRTKFLLGVLLPLAACASKGPQPETGPVDLSSVGAGLAAQIGCGGVFVSGRTPDDVEKKDIGPFFGSYRLHPQLAFDQVNQTVTVTLDGRVRKSIYRNGLGCTLLNKRSETDLRAEAVGLEPMKMSYRPQPWPAGDTVDLTKLPPANKKALDGVVHRAFAAESLFARFDTRAIVVAYDGQIVAEKYGAGFDENTRFLGWSMAKSVVGALVGMLVDDKKLPLDTPLAGNGPPATVPSFVGATDGRQTITLHQLLLMQSGLRFSEFTYLPPEDVTIMLYQQDDMAKYAAEKTLEATPGADWHYSSGTTNILSHLLLDTEGGVQGLYKFMRARLFEPAGMTSAVFEPDGSGAPVASSYLYMTARDWARFGELYREEGEINGQPLLSKPWVEASRSAVQPHSPLLGGGYGYQFWLNQNGANSELRWKKLPADTYMALGHNGQFVVIVPSRKAVIVRLGWTTGLVGLEDLAVSNYADEYFSEILASLPGGR